MALTLAEAIQMLNEYKYRRAIWMEVVNFLARYVDDEVSQAEAVMQTEDCLEVKVPQEFIYRIIEDINKKHIAPLSAQIEDVEGCSVEVGSDEPSEDRKEGKKKADRKATGGPVPIRRRGQAGRNKQQSG